MLPLSCTISTKEQCIEDEIVTEDEIIPEDLRLFDTYYDIPYSRKFSNDKIFENS